MRQKLTLALVMLFVVVAWVLPVGAVPTVNPSQKVHDFAGVLTPVEIENLEALAAQYSEEYSMDMVFVTTEDAEGLGTKKYAEDFLYYNEFGLTKGEKSVRPPFMTPEEGALNNSDTEPNGIIFLLDLDNREYYMATSGFAIRVYDDETIQNIVTRANTALSEGDYYEAMRKTAQTTHTLTEDIYRNAAKSEVGRQEIKDYIDVESVYTQPESLVSRITRAAKTGLLVAFTVSILVVGILLGFHKKSLPAPPQASWYLGDGGMNVLEQTDNFTNSYVTRRRLATNNTNSGGGSSGGFGGGGSSSTSSGGRSYGGGGTKF